MTAVMEAPATPDDDSEVGGHPIYAHAPRSGEFNKLRKRLIRNTREAMEKFAMVRPGEKWLIALSGGKDSYGLLALLLDLKWRGMLPVELLVCNLDQGQPNFPKHILPEFLTGLGIEHRIEYKDTYSIVTEKLPAGATYCSLCSRLRRGNLYRIAREEGCTALVLGHHRDDSLETFFMNMFHGGTFCPGLSHMRFLGSQLSQSTPSPLWEGSREGGGSPDIVALTSPPNLPLKGEVPGRWL